jgi:hypothetical protein
MISISIAGNAWGYAQLGEKFRPPAWPLQSVFIKAKIQMFSRIPNGEWPSSFAQLRETDVMRSLYQLRQVRFSITLTFSTSFKLSK